MAPREPSFNVCLATLKEDFKRRQRINMDKEPAVKDIDNAVLLVEGITTNFHFSLK